jgi:hypothetical protein
MAVGLLCPGHGGKKITKEKKTPKTLYIVSYIDYLIFLPFLPGSVDCQDLTGNLDFNAFRVHALFVRG